MLIYLLLLVFQLLHHNVHASESNLHTFKDMVNDGSLKATETVLKARRILADSKFHTFVGKLEGPARYRLKHLCSYTESTYIFGIAPKLGSGSTVMGFINHDLFLSMEDAEVHSFKSLLLQLDEKTAILAYAHTLGLMGSSTHKDLFQGVLFDRGSGPPTLTLIFKQETGQSVINEFYRVFTHDPDSASPPSAGVLCFDKTVTTQLQTSWDLRVPGFKKPLLVLNDLELISFLFSLIHPMLLYDVALVRSDTDALVCATDLPKLCLQASASHVEKFAIVMMQNVELKDFSILGCKLSRGFEAVVAIAFGNLRVEHSGRNIVAIYLSYDPVRLSDEEIGPMKQAIIELDGYWQYSEKYLCLDGKTSVYNKPAVLEYCKDNVPVQSYSIRNTGHFVALSGEPWAREPLGEGYSFRLRHTKPVPCTSPFTLIGYATFPKSHLPIITNRVFDMLFVKDVSEWIKCVDYVVFQPARSNNDVIEPEKKFELIVAFRQDPVVDKLDIKELMADIMIGVNGAGNFANGLIKNADGTIPIFQQSNGKYYQERTEEIIGRLRLMLPNLKDVQSEVTDFTVYSLLNGKNHSFCPMGTFTSLFDDTLLNSLETEKNTGNFLLLSQDIGDDMLETYSFEMEKSNLQGFVNNIHQWNLSPLVADLKKSLQMVFIEVPSSDNPEKVSFGLGFGVNTAVKLHSECASRLGLDLACSTTTGKMLRPIPATISMDLFEVPWTLTFGPDEERTKRVIDGLTAMQVFLNYFKLDALVTTEINVNEPELISDLKVTLHVKTKFLHGILFEEDIFNAFEGKSKTSMWQDLLIIKFSKLPDRSADEIRVDFILRPTADLVVFARLLNNKLLRLVLMSSYDLNTHTHLIGFLRVGNYRCQISTAKGLLESIPHWPKTIGRKDVLSFERGGLISPILAKTKFSAIRLVVKAERLQHIFAIGCEALMDTVGNIITARSYQFIVRAVKNSPTPTKSNKHMKAFTHVECIWVLSGQLKDNEVKLFAQLFKAALEIFGISTQDPSLGFFNAKTMAYALAQKISFADNALMNELDRYCKNVYTPAKIYEVKKPEPPIAPKKSKPILKVQAHRSAKEDAKAEKVVVTKEQTVPVVSVNTEVKQPDQFPSSPVLELQPAENIVDEPVPMEKIMPGVQAIKAVNTFIHSSRRRFPTTIDVIS